MAVHLLQMETSFTSKQKTAHAMVSTCPAPIGMSYSKLIVGIWNGSQWSNVNE